jgi:hypothetical protein
LKGSEARKLILNDPNFVYLKRFDFSLNQLVERHPEGVPDRIIAAALMMTEEDVEDMYQSIVLKLRHAMKVDLL